MTDQAGAIPMWVAEGITFSYTDATWVVLHKTAGFHSAQECAAYFQAGSDGRNVSSHYIVGQDGVIIQCVPESRGAGANCCLEAGHADYLPTDINLNLKTISIEHIDPALDNSTPCTPEQARASFQLVHDICTRHNIPMRSGDSQGGIIGHNDIAPISRARCPGNYPWADLWAYLNAHSTGGNMSVPNGWRDDGTALLAPNGVKVVLGFREWVLSHAWDASNVPLGVEYHADQILLHNPNVGGGQVQLFQSSMLWWSQRTGVVQEPFLGLEIKAAYDEIARLQAAASQASPPPVPPDKAAIQQAIAILEKLV